MIGLNWEASEEITIKFMEKKGKRLLGLEDVLD